MAAFDPDQPPLENLAIEELDAAFDSEGAIRSGKLAGRSMWSAIWILAIPVLFQQLMTACVGLVDKIFAGNLPKSIVVPALDAIGIGSYVGWLVGIAMSGLGLGGQALIARAIGAGRVEEGAKAAGQAIVLSLVWGAAVGLTMWCLADPLAAMCGLEGQAREFCVQYVRWIAGAMPLTGVMMVGGMCLHGAGETTRPSLISVGVNVVNIVFSWVLSGVDLSFAGRTLYNPFSFDWNVNGIAAGTAISSAFGAAMTAWVLFRGVKDLRLHRRTLRPNRSMAARITRLGVPNFFEGLAMWGVNLFVLTFIGQIAHREIENGTAEGLQGAHIIAVQWEALSFLPGFAMGVAAGALAGQYLGAGNPRMAARSILACAFVAAAIMGTLGVLFMTQGRLLTTFISDEPIHLRHVPNLLFIAGLIQVFFALCMVVRQGLRGAGDAVWPFVITSVSSYGIRLPAAWLLGVQFGYGIEGIWIALCGELIIRAALFMGRFLHGGWKRLRI